MVRAVFDRVIDRLLRRLYQSPVLDRLDLFAYYSFEPRHARSTLARVAELAETSADFVRIEGLAEPLPHPGRFYRLLHERDRREPEEVACSVVHGDLNLANVLLDDAGNTWLIDYYWTRTGHALDDLAKLENDLKFIMVPLADDAALARALALERHLQRQEDLLTPLTGPPPELLADPALAKVHCRASLWRSPRSTRLEGAGGSICVSFGGRIRYRDAD